MCSIAALVEVHAIKKKLSFTFGTFSPRDYHRQRKTPIVQAINPQTNAGDKKQALYNLFAAYLHTAPLGELIESIERARRETPNSALW